MSADAVGRDPRLVAERRGGLLSDADHRLLALWAADCADRVIWVFTAADPRDDRPGAAVELARRWAAGEATVAEARAAAVAAHAAARGANGGARFAARAAGHAVATAHMADHALGAAYYALLALRAEHPEDGSVLDAERRWQRAAVPAAIADLVRDDMRLRAAKFQGIFG